MERSGDPPKVIRLPGVDSGLGSRGSDFKVHMSPSRGRTVYATEVRTPVRWPLICPGRPPVTCSGPNGKALWLSGENSKGRAGSTERHSEHHGRDVRALPCRGGARPQALLGEPGRFCPPTPPCVPPTPGIRLRFHPTLSLGVLPTSQQEDRGAQVLTPL